MTKEVLIIRNYSDEIATYGVLNIIGESHRPIYTLENPWLDNQRNISCIPKGSYECTPYSSPRYPKVYEIIGVQDRSYILFHAGNYPSDTEGCILLGLGTQPEMDMITNSRSAVTVFRSIIGDNLFNLTIKDM